MSRVFDVLARWLLRTYILRSWVGRNRDARLHGLKGLKAEHQSDPAQTGYGLVESFGLSVKPGADTRRDTQVEHLGMTTNHVQMLSPVTRSMIYHSRA